MNSLTITSPASGEVIATLEADSTATLDKKIRDASAVQEKWQHQPRAVRAALLERVSAAVAAHRQSLIELVIQDAGKTPKEAAGEVDGSADILLKTVKDATLPDFNGMARVKERPALGVVGLITSFNFPCAVANWTIAPALLAGNAVVWKPSEKTPLVALEYKKIFEAAAEGWADLLQLAIGGRDIGEALVAHESIDMVSATGSVAMGEGIKAALAKKTNNAALPILELGGNNGVIVSQHGDLEFAASSVMNSFLATSGQRCTNTRRLIVHASAHDKIVSILEQKIDAFISGYVPGAANDVGYGPLIDEDAFLRFEAAKAQAIKEGGKIIGGKCLAGSGYYVEPALALMPSQTLVMHHETFAPLLFIAPYEQFDEAMAMLNAPDNAGLVGGIYTTNAREADAFAAHCQAGHVLINSPKGTGTPAFGMGFGGNKYSGEGEILNAADPLAAFTRAGNFRRIARNVAVELQAD